MESIYPRTITYSAGQPKGIDSLVQSIAFDGGDYIVLQHDSFARDVIVEKNVRLQHVDGDEDFTAEQVAALYREFIRLGGTPQITDAEFLARTYGRGVLWVNWVKN